MKLRTGITTGSCAAAAAKAAAMALRGDDPPHRVEIALPGGGMIEVPVLYARKEENAAVASVRKDAGDDPDATHGMEIVVRVSPAVDGDVTYRAGEGVGIVRKPGLQIPPGEPAINPVPRRMIRDAVREIVSCPLCVEVSIPGGRELAAKTFNPRLGIEGGLSILGTTGIVRPYCTKAMRDALKCAMDVAQACGIKAPVLVPGNIGAKAAHEQFSLRDEQLIEVGNEWGFVLDRIKDYSFSAVLLAGHPGKLAKLPAGQWNTHSSQSDSAVSYVTELAREVLGHEVPQSTTVEGIFAELETIGETAKTRRREDAKKKNEIPFRDQPGNALSARIRLAVKERIGKDVEVAVVLVNMRGERLGSDGDLLRWQ